MTQARYSIAFDVERVNSTINEIQSLLESLEAFGQVPPEAIEEAFGVADRAFEAERINLNLCAAGRADQARYALEVPQALLDLAAALRALNRESIEHASSPADGGSEAGRAESGDTSAGLRSPCVSGTEERDGGSTSTVRDGA